MEVRVLPPEYLLVTQVCQLALIRLVRSVRLTCSQLILAWRNGERSSLELIIYMEELKCIFCGKECKNYNSKRNHERLCKLNPNRDFIRPKTENYYSAIAKRKNSNQFIKAKENCLPIPKNGMKGKSGSFLGKHHSEETKKQISKSMKIICKGKSIWKTQIEKRKSYAENYFDKLFPQLEQNYHVLTYYLDLAEPSKKLYIEIDGEQHYTDSKVIEHDKKRTEELLNEGWICLKRIRWSDFKKLSDKEKEFFIQDLKNKL